MIFDITYFGNGVGLIVLSWIIGLCINAVFALFRKIGLLSLILLSFLSLNYQGAAYAEGLMLPEGTCPVSTNGYEYPYSLDLAITGSWGTGSNCFVSTGYETFQIANPAFEDVLFHRSKVYANSAGAAYISYDCPGSVVSVIACNQVKDTNVSMVSLFLGGLVGIAFVYTAGAKLF
jgi:hypothetical protein